MSNSEDSLAADVASELGERLALERGGNAAVDCKCEAVGVDGENRYLECTYEVTEGNSDGGSLKAASDDETDLGKNNNVNGKVNAMHSAAAAAPMATELLLRRQKQNKKQQGVVAVKVP